MYSHSVCILFLFFFFFFFQAEDGIRDLTVTGVQTCALPIYPVLARWGDRDRAGLLRDRSALGLAHDSGGATVARREVPSAGERGARRHAAAGGWTAWLMSGRPVEPRPDGTA